MDILTIIGTYLVAVIAIVGIMQNIKGFVPEDKREKFPKWIYRIIAIALSVGSGVLMGGELKDIIFASGIIMGMVQLGYDGIVVRMKTVLGEKAGTSENTLEGK